MRLQTAEAVAQGATAHIDPGDARGKLRPVVGIMPVRDDAEAIRLMNDSEFGLTASVLTQEVARAEAIGDCIGTGTRCF